MMIPVLLFVVAVAMGGDLTLQRVFEDTLRNNLEIKAMKFELKAYEREYRSVSGLLFPTLGIEESFTRTDVPAYALFTKMNQGRVSPQDFAPANLRDPSAVSGFETRFTLQIPLWMGGGIRSRKEASLHTRRAQEKTFRRKREEILFDAYRAFLKVSLSKSAVKVAQENLKEAKEHLRVAEKLHSAGVALLSDVLRAQVSLKKAEEKLREAKNNYRLALKALSLVANTDYAGASAPALPSCPSLSLKELKEKALRSREDLKALEERLKALRSGYRATLSENLPQVSAFASYYLYDRDVPFGTEGSGYLVGLRVSLSFNTGLSTVEKALSYRERERALLSRREFMRKSILFEIEKAFTEYTNAQSAIESAEARVRSAQESLRIIRSRYRNGLARIVDLLDSQTQVELARFDYLQALYRCNLSYGKALLAAGILEEVLR